VGSGKSRALRRADGVLYADVIINEGDIVKKWVIFFLLGLIWGSSFLFIRVGVEQASPFQVVFIRTAIAAVGLNIVLAFQKQHLPLNRKGFVPLLILGAFNTVAPFALITWGEKTVASGLASVLNATAALFTLVIAHFSFADERITVRKLVGLLLGFAGVAVLILGQPSEENGGASSVAGMAAAFYGFGGTYGRGVLKQLGNPILVSAGAMTTAAVMSGILMVIAPAIGMEAMTPFSELSGDPLVALLLLGVLNTFVAYLMYYWVVGALGAARSSMVTYVTPPVGITLGAIFLGEPVTIWLIVGGLMILGAIAIVNLRLSMFRTSPAPQVITEPVKAK
jgi:drug/metabolite transporter (DMT)-like permease